MAAWSPGCWGPSRPKFFVETSARYIDANFVEIHDWNVFCAARVLGLPLRVAYIDDVAAEVGYIGFTGAGYYLNTYKGVAGPGGPPLRVLGSAPGPRDEDRGLPASADPPAARGAETSSLHACGPC